jgi:tetratricopeptide (TPR) repeat protein
MPDPVHTAWKVAQIGMMLRKHKDSSALQYLQRSLHLDPAAGKVWRSLGHARAKDGRLRSACAAFRSAIVFDPETDLEARTALATLLAQMGKAAASADELLKVRSLDPNFGVITESLEWLCRRPLATHIKANVGAVEPHRLQCRVWHPCTREHSERMH